MAMKAVKATAQGAIYTVELDGSLPLHRALQKELGGYIEVVRPRNLARPYLMMVDEEGLLKGLPLNRAASWLCGTQRHGQPIVGDALIMKETETADGDADAGGLTDEECNSITAWIALNEIIIGKGT